MDQYKDQYKTNRRQFTAAKIRVGEINDLQEIAEAESDRVVPDLNQQILLLNQRIRLNCELITQEITAIKTSIESMDGNLSQEIVNNLRVKPGRLSAEMNSKLVPELQELISL